MTQANAPREADAVRLGLVIGQLTVGGAEGQLAELVRCLGRQFLPIVYILAAADPALISRLEAAGAEVRQVGGRGWVRARRLAAALRNDRVALIHSWLFIANAYAAATRLFGLRTPLITSARNCKTQGRANQLANSIAFRLSAAIIVNSADVDAFIVRHYRAPHRRIRVVHNGVDAERFRPAATPAETPTIITVGRLVRQKNHELFVRAAAALARERPDCRFLIVGEGPLRPQLAALAAELGLGERLVLAGERADVTALLRQATLFWLTSRWEGMPNVVLEAMASGVPVIATDVGGVRELVNDQSDGLVVASEDADAFVRGSRELLADPQRRQRMSTNARARAEQFSTPKMAEALGRIYLEVMSGR